MYCDTVNVTYRGGILSSAREMRKHIEPLFKVCLYYIYYIIIIIFIILIDYEHLSTYNVQRQHCVIMVLLVSHVPFLHSAILPVFGLTYCDVTRGFINFQAFRRIYQA